MAEEPIVIAVSETGTDQVAAKLTALGAAGDTAGKQAAASISTASSAYSSFAAQLAAAAAAAQANAQATSQAAQATTQAGQAAQGAATATQALTGATQAATGALGAQAGAAGGAAAATNQVAAANTAAAANATAHSASVRGLAASYTALNEVMKVAALLFSVNMFVHAIDGATEVDFTLKRLTKTTGDYNEVYQSLLKSANATGNTLDGTVRLFQSLTVATQGTTVSHRQLLLAVDSVEKALLLSGVTSEHASRVLRDITEAAAQGTLTSRQLVTILAQAPGVMELITAATGKTTKQLLDLSAAHKAAGSSAKQLSTEMTAAEKVRTAELDISLKKSKEHDLAVLTSATSTQAQIKAADDRVVASKRHVAEEHEISSARIQENEKHNAAAVKESAKAFEDVVPQLASVNAAISAQVAEKTLTIAQSFQVLKNNLEAYFVVANQADGVNSKLATGIAALGAAIPVLVPMVVAFGAAWLGIKAYGIVEQITLGLVALAGFITTTLIPAIITLGTTVLFAFGPWTVLIYAIIGALAYLAARIAGVQDPLQATIDKFKQLGSIATTAFNDAVKGAVDTSKAMDTVKSATQSATGAMQGLTAATQQYADVAGAALAGSTGRATTGGDVWNSSYPTRSEPAPTWGGSGGNPPPGVEQPPQLATTGGSVEQLSSFASGGKFRVGGVGPVDSKLVQFMASPGERIIIQTPDQQRRYDQLPHFASGGQLNVSASLNDAVTLGLQGMNIAFVASGTNSLVGYNAPTPSPAAASAVSSAPSTSSPVSSAASGASSAATSFTTPDSGTITAAEAASIAYYEQMTGQDPFAGSDVDRVRALAILKRLGDPNGPQEYLYYPFGGGAGKDNVATWFDIVKINKDGSAVRDDWRGGTTWPTIGAFTHKGVDPGMAPVVARARDGLDFTVPGAGAVDSRVLSMAVSPGEQVSVKTPEQQRFGGGMAGKTLVQNINIQTTDADSYGRSQKQIMRDLGNKMMGAF